MAKTTKKHWDIVLMAGAGLVLAIVAMLGVNIAPSIPSVEAVATSTQVVDVTATVAESIALTVSSTPMALGTLTTAGVSSISNNFLVKTNSGSGYTVQLKDKDYAATSSAPGLHKLNATVDIIASGAATLEAGVEGYGAQGTTTDVGNVTINAAYLQTGNTVGALAITNQLFCTGAGVTTGDTSVLTLKAAISAATLAGSYVDQLTLAAVGTF